MEYLSSAETNTLINDLKNQIQSIKTDIKNKDYKGLSLQLLQSKSDYLEQLYKKYVANKVISEDDYNEAYSAMKAQSKNELYLMQLKAKRNLLIMICIGIVITGVVIYKIKK